MRSGVPPSVIADTWSPDELQDAEVLADLEGIGQTKRMVARISAEIHNASINIMQMYRQMKSSNVLPPAKYVSEKHFLYRKVRRLRVVKDSRAEQQKPVSDRPLKELDFLAGFK